MPQPLKVSELLEKYLVALAKAPLGLIGTRDITTLRDLHIDDALTILASFSPHELDQPNVAIDIGTGAGLPGVPLAIACPKWRFTLVDSNNKKCGFLDMFCKINGIKNAVVICDRAERLAHFSAHREKYTYAFSRALTKLPIALELTAPYVVIGGRVIIPSAKPIERIPDMTPGILSQLGIRSMTSRPYTISHKNIRREFFHLIFEKISLTAPQFPRSPKLIQRSVRRSSRPKSEIAL